MGVSVLLRIYAEWPSSTFRLLVNVPKPNGDAIDRHRRLARAIRFTILLLRKGVTGPSLSLQISVARALWSPTPSFLLL